MNRIGLLAVIALAGLTAAEGQAIKDPGLMWGPPWAPTRDSWVPIPNLVRVSTRAQMIASLEQSRVRIGDPIILHYRLKNVSSGVIGPLFYNGFGDECWLMVTDASGAELPRTKEGDRLRERPTVLMAAGRGLLGPGVEENDKTIDVSKLYRLDRPGNYFVRIARRMGVPPDVPSPKTPQEWEKTPTEEAVSEPIPFTITP